MPPRNSNPLEDAHSLQSTALHALAAIDESPILPIAYAAFMLVCGASILSGPTWVLMMAMSLFLLGACLRAAAIDAIERAQHVLMADEEEGSSVDLSATNHNMFTLLRTARVVLLPRNYNAARMVDVERGAGHDTVLITQIAQQLNRARSGQVPPWAQTIIPVSQEDLDALPICTYLPSTRLSASRFSQQARNLMSAPGEVSASGAASQHGASAGISSGSCSAAAAEASDCEDEGLKGARSGRSEGGESEGGFACSICLEDVSAGEKVMTLPCLHQYHADCVRPWLERKGKHAACPMCKTPVFP